MPKPVATPAAEPIAEPTNPQAAAPAPAPAAPAPAPQAADVQAAVDAALAARAQINQQIEALARSVRLSSEEAQAVVAQNLTLDAARAAILDVVAKRDASHQPTNHVTVQHDSGTLRQDVAKGLMVRAGMAKAEEGNQFTTMTLGEIASAVCSANGISVHGVARGTIAAQALHSTSDFPAILADVANKSLRAGYDAYPRTFLPFSRRVSATDFKPINRMQLGEAPALEKVNESGEFKRGTMSDGKESYKLQTFGKIIGFTRQTIIDDDLDALTRVPQSFGDAAADLENSQVWGLITSNVKLSDNVTLFHANHHNLGSAGAPSDTTLSEARKLMRLQKGLDAARPLNLRAQYLIVPAALETTAQKLLSAIMATDTSDVNVFSNSMELIVEPLLDVASATAWYTAAAPARIDTIEYAYLSGEEGVVIETRNGWDVDGVEIKARLDFGCGVIDYRGLTKNAGA